MGVFGGTFDPIHLGHLVAAEAVRDAEGLDLVIFVPNWRQPLKSTDPGAGANQRLAMVDLAIAGNAGFTVSEAELRREGPSFSINTLEHLQREHSGSELKFILGVDAVNQLAQWREPRRILAEFTPIIMLRAGWPGPDWSIIDQIYPRASQELHVVEVPALEIASSTIRAKVSAGQSVRYLVSDPVLEVIERDGLYRLDASSVPE